MTRLPTLTSVTTATTVLFLNTGLDHLYQPLTLQIFTIAIWLPSPQPTLPFQNKANEQAELVSRLLLEVSNHISASMVRTITDIQTEKAKESQRQLQLSLEPFSGLLQTGLSTLHSPRIHQGGTQLHPRPTRVQEVQVLHRIPQETVQGDQVQVQRHEV